ncbi:hypothetical protein T484DRAFT_1789716 [Baffinella frigidus]|nr:hypothetical protein T484DRAFT_1789716 [Cryptophyta sp. CCMP2293]
MDRGLRICLSLALLIGAAGPRGAASASPAAPLTGSFLRHREACLNGRTQLAPGLVRVPAIGEEGVFPGPRSTARGGRHGALAFALPCLARRPQLDVSSAACRWLPGTRALPRPTSRQARIVGGRRREGAVRGGAAGLTAKLRDEALDALSIDLIEQILGAAGTAEGLVKKAFQKLGDRISNEQREKVSPNP